MSQKIYFTCLHLNHGGVEMAISLLSNALCRRGFDVEILCTYNFGKPAYEIDARVKITYLTELLPNREEFHQAIKSQNPLAIIKEGAHSLQVLYQKKQRLKRVIMQIKEGIIISTRHEDSLLLSKYGSPGVLKIAQLHHDHHFSPKLFDDFKHHYTNIDYFVLLTDKLRDEISEIMKQYNTKTRCITIPNFLPFKDDNSLGSKKKQVISVGRLHTDKAFHRLIEVWSLVHQKHPDWILKIVGNGPLKEDLKNQVSKLGLNDSIILTGALNHEEVMTEMASSSIYAMTSISEAFPFVLLEAMYNYLPIVAYDVRVGPSALVKDKETGYLVPDNNANAFCDSLCNLIENADIISQFQQASYEFVQSFSEEQVVKLWLSIF